MRSRAATSLPRWALVVCGVTLAVKASSVAVNARPPSSAHRILARAGSPTRAATSAIWGAFDMPRIWAQATTNATADTSTSIEANCSPRLIGPSTAGFAFDIGQGDNSKANPDEHRHRRAAQDPAPALAADRIWPRLSSRASRRRDAALDP